MIPEPTVSLFTNTKTNLISTAMIKMAVRFAWQTEGKPHSFITFMFVVQCLEPAADWRYCHRNRNAQERRSEDVQPQFFFVVLYPFVCFNILLKCETGTSEVGSVNEYCKHTDKSLFFLSHSQPDEFLSVAWWGFSCIIRVQMTSTHLLCPIRLPLHVYSALITQ
jgi:hypothetical protein